VISTPQSARDRELDRIAFARLAEVHRTMAPLDVPAPASTPSQVDLSGHVRLIRDQNGGPGCFGYSMLAMWDIMNDLACPYSPNLSMRLWLLMHHRRELWEPQGGIFTPDGRFHPMKVGPEFGCAGTNRHAVKG
jgi:hypothetical protein